MSVVPGTKYDPAYKKESNAAIAGFVLLGLSVCLYLLVPHEKQVQVVSNMSLPAKMACVLMDLLLRALVTGWVKKIATAQNRDRSIWGLFAFFFPSIVLIAIGFTRKIDRSNDMDTPEVKLEKRRLRTKMVGLFVLVMIIVITLLICLEQVFYGI